MGRDLCHSRFRGHGPGHHGHDPYLFRASPRRMAADALHVPGLDNTQGISGSPRSKTVESQRRRLSARPASRPKRDFQGEAMSSSSTTDAMDLDGAMEAI